MTLGSIGTRLAVWWRTLTEEQGGSRLCRGLAFLLRLTLAIVRKTADVQLNLWSMSLVYTTLLSLVPLLAVSFSVLKAFGVHNQLDPLLLELLAPLGQQGIEIKDNILGFVDNLKVGVLGSLGLAFLFYTVISLLQKVEQAFNAIWQVPETRSLGRRFADYLSVILVGPVLLFSALGLAQRLLQSGPMQELLALEPLGGMLLALGRLLPHVLIGGAFAFSYIFMTNTRVRLGAALAGGVFAGALWYASGRLFTALVVDSSSYSAIYSGFAAAVLLIIWLNLAWLIILLGAQVAYYWQHPRSLLPTAARGEEWHSREGLALEVMALVAQAHQQGQALWTADALQQRYVGKDAERVSALLEALRGAGLLVTSSDEPPRYLPGRAPAAIPLAEVVAVARGGGGGASSLPRVALWQRRLEQGLDAALADASVADLLEEDGGGLSPAIETNRSHSGAGAAAAAPHGECAR
ncbi:MAG TPA: YihY/virulence factor BrkB family protein [Candidatus Competibacteraceae bacterium]|nr:YihY/virulence factor BrkB family protein [Candidatus Competibacteraceae bacterium]